MCFKLTLFPVGPTGPSGPGFPGAPYEKNINHHSQSTCINKAIFSEH